jgi:hypothetical protein
MEPASRIRIGTAGWSYKDWDGILYPPEVTRKKVHPVEFLARFFDVIEINTSFYGHGRNWVVCGRGKQRRSIQIFFSPRSCTGRSPILHWR